MGRPGWLSYDSVAADYDRVATPSLFAGPARDLVAALRPPPGGLVLDAGTGPGNVALLAAEAMGPAGAVVGLDPSLDMLRIARRRGILRLAAGAVPGLPFPDRTFDCVAGGFVLSHVRDYEAALRDLVRVLRPGGRLGVSAWGETRNAFSTAWKEVAESFVDPGALAEAVRQLVPWEDWFADAGRLGQALAGAGLAGVRVERRRHRITMAVPDYLASRELAGPARFMRATLGQAEWERFRRQVAGAFQREFPEPVAYEAEALCALGTRPAA